MSIYPSKLNLNRLTLPQRKYLQRLNIEEYFKGSRDTSWMVSTREQLLKRKMIEWFNLGEEHSAIRMTERGKEAILKSSDNW
jgi:hypothetical protein